jgi:hypothetical protein
MNYFILILWMKAAKVNGGESNGDFPHIGRSGFTTAPDLHQVSGPKNTGEVPTEEIQCLVLVISTRAWPQYACSLKSFLQMVMKKIA